MPWCPYTDLELQNEATSPEHIIPLSLGGSNEFCIPVQKAFNGQAGSEIDGALTKDVLIAQRRREFDARGHSNKAPKVILKKSQLGDGKKPVQVTLRGKDAPLIWDAKAKCYLAEQDVLGEVISSQFEIGRYDRFRFVAKVALSAGYFIYGDLFRKCVQHNQLRALMNFAPPEPREGFKDLAGYDEFSPVNTGDMGQNRCDRLFCQLISGSCVMAVPSSRNVIFTVGVLGGWVGTLNVPAITDSFPNEGLHDLGHVIALQERKITRMSYRQLAGQMLVALQGI